MNNNQRLAIYEAQWVKPNTKTGLPFRPGEFNSNGDLFLEYNFESVGTERWIDAAKLPKVDVSRLWNKENKIMQFGDLIDRQNAVVGIGKIKDGNIISLHPIIGAINPKTGLPYLPGDVDADGRVFRMYSAKFVNGCAICREIWLENNNLSPEETEALKLRFGVKNEQGMVFNRLLNKKINIEVKANVLKKRPSNKETNSEKFPVGWSERQTNDLIRLWFLGSSANQIGKVVHKSRNAVLSKANRLDLPRSLEFKEKLKDALNLSPPDGLSPDLVLQSHTLLNQEKDVSRSTTTRLGQQEFRKDILRLFENRCAISGTEEASVLEAAHIIPYSKSQDNDPSNGLCLRADIHSLFDLGMLTITENLIVKVSGRISDPEYSQFHDKKLDLPIRAKIHINRSFLNWHLINVFYRS